jgi:phospholipid transport system substrate-binding protein
MVITHINPDAVDGPTKVVFQVRNSSDEYKILDVKIQGVSIIVTQRDEFTGFISNNGGEIGPLIKALRKKTASLKTRARERR